MASCLKRTRTAIAVCKAIISRTLFALHGFICIWRVTVIKGEPLYWCLTGTLPVMVFETIFTIKKKKGGEWKWVCPSVLLYLGTAVPAIWFMELDLMKSRMMTSESQSSHDVTQTHTNISEQDAMSDVLNGKLHLKISLGEEEWCKILEQMLLLILIVGRWLLPKGEITREQLSQLLLVYIGMAADIIELFEAFKEKGVRENYMLTLIILALWTASLTQFTFVLTATKAKRMRPVLFRAGSSASAINIRGKSCCPTEVLSIVISMMLQDGPFLVLRMLLIFRYDVLSYTNLFFTSKNTLVLVLQFYRLIVLFSQKKEDESGRAKALRAESAQQNDSEGGSLHGSVSDLKSRKIRKSEPATVKFIREDHSAYDEGLTSDDDSDDDDIMNVTEFGKRKNGRVMARSARSPISTRRESYQRQQQTAQESPQTSTEREYYEGQDENYATGTPSSHSSFPHSAASLSDAEPHAVKRLKPKTGRRKVSEDSTRGSMSDSREDVRRGKGRVGKKGVRRQRSAKEHWQDVKSLAKAIAFVNEAGKYKTLILKPIETVDHQTVFVVESEHVGKMKHV